MLESTGRRALRRVAAESLAWWLTNYRHPDGRVGVQPEELVEAVCGTDPFFRAVLDGLRRNPNWDPSEIRASKAMIAHMDATDYWQILRDDALHEQHHAHAMALSTREVWPHFARQMHAAKALLLAV